MEPLIINRQNVLIRCLYLLFLLTIVGCSRGGYAMYDYAAISHIEACSSGTQHKAEDSLDLYGSYPALSIQEILKIIMNKLERIAGAITLDKGILFLEDLKQLFEGENSIQAAVMALSKTVEEIAAIKKKGNIPKTGIEQRVLEQIVDIWHAIKRRYPTLAVENLITYWKDLLNLYNSRNSVMLKGQEVMKMVCWQTSFMLGKLYSMQLKLQQEKQKQRRAGYCYLRLNVFKRFRNLVRNMSGRRRGSYRPCGYTAS
ncbi:hypothetical protein [Candidatus Cardinium hertigii]|uniref:Uncharacterized protein n=1 Tax=Candidatus Cardinium hertigii TaxID=247481 RepID=A0A2Z3LJ70_9BACT|nr:hypothetical protein [Candidatus Cardinium hertigii]AWN82100.1 hypothetical protein DK880_00794 [Candidatus Cardinium hertigii]